MAVIHLMEISGRSMTAAGHQRSSVQQQRICFTCTPGLVANSPIGIDRQSSAHIYGLKKSTILVQNHALKFPVLSEYHR
jgi:hypothetical protein